MTQTIWKYDLPIDDQTHTIDMPWPGAIIHTAVGPTTPIDHVSVWAVVESDSPKRQARGLRVVGTGHPMPDRSAWVGTAVDPYRPLVWHVVEVGR